MVTIAPAFNPDRSVFTPVRPLVYEDGLTILEYLKILQKWINSQLITHINDELKLFQEAVDKLIIAVDKALQDQKEEISDLLAQQIAEFNEILSQVINNSVELQDPVMAGIVSDIDALTSQALYKTYPVYRIYNEITSLYPARIPGAFNIFVGPVDPGMSMAEDDVWSEPNTVTIPDIITEINTLNSQLRQAIQNVGNSQNLILSVRHGDPLEPMLNIGTQPAVITAQGVNKTATNGVRCVGQVPPGWNTGRICFRWINPLPPGNARFNIYANVSADGVTSKHTYTTTTSFPSGETNVPTKIVAGTIPTKPGDYLSVAIIRLATNALDTIPGTVGIMDVWIEKLS